MKVEVQREHYDVRSEWRVIGAIMVKVMVRLFFGLMGGVKNVLNVG